MMPGSAEVRAVLQGYYAVRMRWEIYEPILKDMSGKVTTGLLHAVGYLKDTRLLPKGFDKSTAEKDIAGRRSDGRSGVQR